MRRRRYIASASAGLSVLLSGCGSLISNLAGGSAQKDTDGDGISDEHDYAPKDPDVQVESDALGQTTTATSDTFSNVSVNSSLFETTTSEEDDGIEVVIESDTEDINTSDGSDDDFEFTATSTTTPTSELDLSTNRMQADTEVVPGQTSYFTAYSLQDASITLTPETIDDLYPSGARLLVVAGAYPDELFGSTEAEARSPLLLTGLVVQRSSG